MQDADVCNKWKEKSNESQYYACALDVFTKYNVKSVYDPCAGWGERMMTCGKLGVSYEGCDINSELFEGYEKLAKLIDGFKPVLHNNDSANQLVTTNVDAVITCPPPL